MGFEFWGRCVIGWGACDREMHNVMDADVYLFYFLCSFVFVLILFLGT